MGIKIFMVSFIVTSIFLIFFYIPIRLTTPISNSRNYFNAIKSINNNNNNRTYPVTFAYLISASKGDFVKLKRLMKVLYHPGNYYLIHMDYGAPQIEHKKVAEFVANEPVFGEVGNVGLLGNPICASDYPLVTQDDLIQAFSEVPRDINFVQHSSRLGWKFNKRGKPMIIDPGLYSLINQKFGGSLSKGVSQHLLNSTQDDVKNSET
ncbi:Beta-glucuronosyltransferase GlcAT14B [Arachis hypogaea]|nr:Beta-glucuronosyltransferase GlcAT14B [Arachis hypogaea]